MRSVKLKIESKFRRAQDKERLKNAVGTAVSGLQTILQIAREAAGNNSIPGLQGGIGGLLVVMDVVKVMPFHDLCLPYVISTTEDLHERGKCRETCESGRIGYGDPRECKEGWISLNRCC